MKKNDRVKLTIGTKEFNLKVTSENDPNGIAARNFLNTLIVTERPAPTTND